MLLTVGGIDVHYGSAQVLHSVSINIKEGELICIVGRNGAGKTTLLKTIAGFQHPSKGTIAFDGIPIQTIKPEKIAMMGIKYVFQDKRVFGDLTVRENIQLAAYPVGASLDESIAKLLNIHEKMKIYLDSKAKGLSGGERQILLIGRALVGNPRLLLIDEPTEGLAAKVIGDISRILTTTKGTVSMIVVEQNLAIVSRLADRIYIMKEGSVIKEITEPGEIRDQEYIQSLL
jgi:ABC-type branched-subunit amino acid transport system ATPase component